MDAPRKVQAGEKLGALPKKSPIIGLHLTSLFIKVVLFSQFELVLREKSASKIAVNP